MKRGMNNKAQVTIFIIVAVVILVIIGLFFIFRDTLKSEENSVDANPVYVHTVSCLESMTEEGIEYIGLRGGYYNIPEDISFSYLADEDSYYYINSVRRIPSIERVKKELGDYIKENLDFCINFDSLEKEGFSVTKGELTLLIDIKEEEIDVEANYPITLKKGEDTSRFKDFGIEINSGLDRVYTASEEIVNSYYLKPGFVCMTCLDETSSKYDVLVKATSLAEKEVIWFSVSDIETGLEWRFVVEQ